MVAKAASYRFCLHEFSAVRTGNQGSTRAAASLQPVEGLRILVARALSRHYLIPLSELKRFAVENFNLVNVFQMSKDRQLTMLPLKRNL
jgi:hypothetical protein